VYEQRLSQRPCSRADEVIDSSLLCPVRCYGSKRRALLALGNGAIKCLGIPTSAKVRAPQQGHI